MTAGIKLVNQKYKLNQFYHYLTEVDNVLIISKIKNKFIVVRQKRIPISKTNYEFPVGRVENNESIYCAAKREFEEETGYKINGKLKKLFSCFIDPGRNTKKIHYFFSDQVVKKSYSEKGISVYFLSKNEIEELIFKGMFNSAFNIAAFYYFLYKNN